MSKHEQINADIGAEVQRALREGDCRLLGSMPFRACRRGDATVVLVYPTRLGHLNIGTEPHCKLAECVVIVEGDKVAVTHISRAFVREWESFRGLR